RMRVNKHEYVFRTETSQPHLERHIVEVGSAELSGAEQSDEEALRRARDLRIDKVQSLVRAVDVDETIVAEKKHSAKVERLTRLRESVLNLKIMLIKLENEDDAYLIFETLNTRGKDLALTDLAKNHFTKLIKDQSSVDYVKIKWSTILETIYESDAEINSDSFIYHFWASRNESVPMKKLYPVIKKKINGKNAKKYLDALVRDAQFYRAIHEPAFMWDKSERDVASSLAAIQLFRVAQPTPALLSLVRAYKDGKIKLAKIREALSAIEKFHFAFTAVTSSRSSGGISGMYSAFARKLFDAEDSNQAAREISDFIKKLRQRRPALDEFVVRFRDIGFTNSFTKQKSLVRYILRKFAERGNFK